MRRHHLQGFGIVEALISLFIVGIILGVVARGYQALNRLQLASYQMSIRLELMSFLQRLSYETSSALTLSTSGTGFSFQRINPTLNLKRDQAPKARLPWVSPGGIPKGATSTGLLLDGDAKTLITTTYAYDAPSLEIRRTAFGSTSVVARDVGEFSAATEAGGKILRVRLRPSNLTASVVVKVLLPVVTP